MASLLTDFGRTYSAKMLDYAGFPSKAKALRKLGEHPEEFNNTWGKPSEAAETVQRVMEHTGKMIMCSYLDDLLTMAFKRIHPLKDESFMRWAVRARIGDRTDLFFQKMPLTMEDKWKLIAAQVQHAGFHISLDDKCFKGCGSKR